ncbi:MAG: helix-turn-helix domain-containing protein [Clostridium sp.]|uniref:helix-turn-helix domain-containing protein n=1 Tax=Clostridium sp. TaxID=1506 RepID=UPI0025BC8B45|nr:helix-turn-helix domain-containing protein [Clostridium sp.]MCH3965515.1 helix-turn-helix domain-containing protein [Clostridium sp.]MCI1716844.1 helix-turn-helix domain-containing protein [Clostridium sp.]MCI1801226.1 helix-turn-helix domain-containing protein [Clostridium sp.]MCI1815030.1 helix-turn-helix domain-containing protein [Clostridium sp.]MCI1871931.1 helix-turn-helix domain-containing protein [Clostridium sp.]
MEENHDEILTVKETAAFLKICRTKAYEIFGKQEFPSFKIGKSLRVRKKDLLNYLLAHIKNNPNN